MGKKLLYSEVMKHFDHAREDFTPYGFTCEVWEPRQMSRPDRHNEVEINLLDEGSLTYLIWGRRVTVHAGRLVAFWAAIPHQIMDFRDVTFYYVVTLPLAWALNWGLPDRLVKALLNGQVVEESRPNRSRLDQPMFAQWHDDLNSGSVDLQKVVLLELKARLLRLAQAAGPLAAPAQPKKRKGVAVGRQDLTKVERMAAFVATNYTGRVRVADVGESVGLNPDYAASLFKKTFGVTLNSFLTEHRVMHAQRMLVTTDAKVLEVALDSGFNSLSRFNAAFKAICGCTPRQYRVNHRL